MKVKYGLCAFALALVGSTSAFGQDQIGEKCSGTETVKVGANPQRVVPYTLTFSADLAAGYYCYAECKPEQTYAIKDRTSDPIKLADFNGGSQVRHITFSRKTGILTDFQALTVLSTVTRNARATCQPTAFHKPTPLPGD